MEKPKLTNWAKNIIYSTDILHEVTSVEQIQNLVQSQERVSVVGTGHTFNAIADSSCQISLRMLHDVVAVDAVARTVTVDAGITCEQLCPYLDRIGFALHNLTSVSGVSIAGVCSTAAHGSGNKNGNLATSVCALEMVTAEGDLVKLSRQTDGEIFCGAVVGLGALGVITRITLDIQPAFRVRQYVYEDLPLAKLKDHFDTIMSSGYSVSLFTNWQDQRISEVWIKNRVDLDEYTFVAPQEYFGAKLATENRHPVRELSAENCTQQLGVPGQSYERLPHFCVGFIPSVGDELQSEYFVPRRHAVDAIFALERLHDQVSPYLFVSEIRTIAADDLWMSTCYRRESVAIHFTWKHNWPAVRRLLPIIERELSQFDPRPHWGKLFSMSPKELQSKYEKLNDFLQLAAKYDPKGKFRNDFLNSNIFTH